MEFIKLSAISIDIGKAQTDIPTQRYFSAEVAIKSGVFSGEFQTSFFDEDFEQFKKDLRGLSSQGGVAKLGGGRSAEVTFQFAKQIGGIEGSLAATISACICGDDPYPMLTFLEFNVPPTFAEQTIQKIDQILHG